MRSINRRNNIYAGGWNAEFYQSRAWKDCRLSFLISKHFICERCWDIATIAHHKTKLLLQSLPDPYISLSHDNLESLCQTCHNTAHHETAPRAERYASDIGGQHYRLPPIRERPQQPINRVRPIILSSGVYVGGVGYGASPAIAQISVHILICSTTKHFCRVCLSMFLDKTSKNTPAIVFA